MISTDDVETLERWSKSLNAAYPMLSDATGAVTRAYGVMMPGGRMASRTTFVIDKDGKVREIQRGRDAIDTTGALAACSRLSGAHHGRAK